MGETAKPVRSYPATVSELSARRADRAREPKNEASPDIWQAVAAQLGSIGTIYEPGGTRKQRFYRLNVECLTTRLRLMGLLSHKHIPQD
jgi:hypothetical protein